MSAPAERSNALQDLSGIFGFIEIDGLEDIVGVKTNWRLLACSQEMRDVLHLDKGHGGGFEANAGRRRREIDESVVEKTLRSDFVF